MLTRDELTIEKEQQCVHLDRVHKTIIVSHGKGKTCPAVGLGGEESVPLLLALERPMFHEQAIKFGTDCVRARVALNVENGWRRLVAGNVGHDLTGPYKTHGKNVSQPRCEGLDKR